ncbi:hypothetical protein [Kineothrix sedimenti]|uniref:Uncharacterized protein n=1 Tax=Kineothrix sedimenti TaxID=3123317 RepID=A0ABZ3ESP4_9FIRM
MKKRIILIVSLIFIIIARLFFWNNGGDVSSVKRTVTISEVYSEKDINDAMDIVVMQMSLLFYFQVLMLILPVEIVALTLMIHIQTGNELLTIKYFILLI